MIQKATIIVLLLATLSIGCRRPVPPNNAEDTQAAERRRAVLADMANEVVVPAYEGFASKSAELGTAVEAWQQSGSPDDRATAREAWREAMLSWEAAEVFQFGPAGPMGEVIGGADLRDAIYSWPTTNACRVDQELVEQNYTDVDAFRSEPVNVRGLDALEYLLFREGTENDCDATRGINADGSWAMLDEAELESRRAAYAATLAADLNQSADALVDAWTSGFADELATAGTSSETYPSTHEALNSVSDALFYVETDVKDMKLGEPAGVLNCATAVCPEQREFLWSDTNFDAIAANLDGFERLFTGGDALGFDDLLADAGQAELSDEMLAKLATARTRAAGTEVTMADALESDTTVVTELHADVKAVTDLLKTQFVSVLDLELPMRAEGDND